MKLNGSEGFRVTLQRGENIDETRRVDADTLEIAYEDAPVSFLLLRESLRKASEKVDER